MIFEVESQLDHPLLYFFHYTSSLRFLYNSFLQFRLTVLERKDLKKARRIAQNTLFYYFFPSPHHHHDHCISQKSEPSLQAVNYSQHHGSFSLQSFTLQAFSFKSELSSYLILKSKYPSSFATYFLIILTQGLV